MNIISICLTKEEHHLFDSYAELTGQPVSTLLKVALTEKIEDYLDLHAGLDALQTISGENVTLQEMMKEESPLSEKELNHFTQRIDALNREKSANELSEFVSLMNPNPVFYALDTEENRKEYNQLLISEDKEDQ